MVDKYAVHQTLCLSSLCVQGCNGRSDIRNIEREINDEVSAEYVILVLSVLYQALRAFYEISSNQKEAVNEWGEVCNDWWTGEK